MIRYGRKLRVSFGQPEGKPHWWSLEGWGDFDLILSGQAALFGLILHVFLNRKLLAKWLFSSWAFQNYQWYYSY